MRRRTRRDLGVLGGAIVIIGAITFVNMQFMRSSLAQQKNAERQGFEQARLQDDGIMTLSWKLIKATRGSLKKGGVYVPELLEQGGQITYLMGFMVPQEQFRDVTEFLLLPIPIECYFCSMPPARDVILIRMAEGETTQFYDQPVLIKGLWNNFNEPNTKFFYSMEGSYLESAEKGAKLKARRIDLRHMVPEHEQDPSMLLDPVDFERSME